MIQKFHLGHKYIKYVTSHNLLRGDVTTNILDNKGNNYSYQKINVSKHMVLDI